MRVIVHGGMHKAGSSAVQAYLATERSALRETGIDYPDFGHAGHWLVSAGFSGNIGNYHHIKRRSHSGDPEAQVVQMREELAERAGLSESAPDTLLLSHEDLSVNATATRLDRFFQSCSTGESPTQFVAYVRDPASMYPSVIQQVMKSERSRELLPSEWISPHIQRSTRLKASFGDRATLRPYAPPGSADWDVIDDFRETCGVLLDRELPLRGEVADANTSLSAEACAILELARKTELNRGAARFIPRLCRFFTATERGTKLRVPEGWARDIRICNAAGWNEVIDLLDCSAEQKAAMRIEEGALSRVYTDADIQGWLLDGLDRDWCERFAAFCPTVELPGNAGLKVSRWIRREVLR